MGNYVFRSYENNIDFIGDEIGLLPVSEEIDEMIQILNNIKSFGDEYINKYNKDKFSTILNYRPLKINKTIQKGYIYIIECNGYYKIGRTKFKGNRIAQH